MILSFYAVGHLHLFHPLRINALSTVVNVFADDSTSMNIGNRIPALQQTIKCVSEIATILEPSGMSIRFLNSTQDGNFNNLTNVNDIMQKVQMVDYNGYTLLGTQLRDKIVNPMIIQRAENNTLKKPVIVAAITDGEVSLSDTLIGVKGAQKCPVHR